MLGWFQAWLPPGHAAYKHMPDQFHSPSVEIQNSLHIQQLDIAPAGFLAYLTVRGLFGWFMRLDASGDGLPVCRMPIRHCMLEQQQHRRRLFLG